MIKLKILFASCCVGLLPFVATCVQPLTSPSRQTMSLLPSSPAVQEKLETLREQKAAAKATFLAALEIAKVDWEAELLLELEEFRDKGGFGEVYTMILNDLNRNNWMRQEESQGEQQTPVAQLENFVPDELDVKHAIYHAYENVSDINIKNRLYVVTPMNLECAILRHRILSGIRTEIYTSAKTEQDRALLERRQRLMGRRF
jgi:hypothetical protein